jgi:hypothetical protein
LAWEKSNPHNLEYEKYCGQITLEENQYAHLAHLVQEEKNHRNDLLLA